jgi:deoxyribonuclease-4
MFGYHVPVIKKSFKKSIEEPHKRSNINAFQLFVRNPRALKVVEHKEKEAQECKEYVLANDLFVVSHATYLLNSATETDWDNKIASAINELLYSEKIGAKGSVFHVGKHLKQTPEEGTELMFKFISEVIDKLQKIDSKSIYILETCAACGTELLADLKDFGNFYHRFSDKQKENLKICIDTCHVFSAGYSLKSHFDAEQFIQLVEEYIGWKEVLLIHLNDSKKDCGCHVDRHENLCVGCIGKDDESGLAFFVNHCYNLKIPLVLETPHDDDNMYEVYAKDLGKIRGWLNLV